jgi:hypothetical protein
MDWEEEEPASDEDYRPPKKTAAGGADKNGAGNKSERALRMTDKERRLRERQEAEERNRSSAKKGISLMEKIRDWFVHHEARQNLLLASQFDDFVQFAQAHDNEFRAGVQDRLHRQVEAALAHVEKSIPVELQGPNPVETPLKMHDYIVGGLLPTTAGADNPFWKEVATPMVPPPADGKSALERIQQIKSPADLLTLLHNDPYVLPTHLCYDVVWFIKIIVCVEV